MLEKCDFELLALRPAGSGTINVYAHSQHNHPIMPKRTDYFYEYLIFYSKKLQGKGPLRSIQGQ
jgi:hypothetical protein